MAIAPADFQTLEEEVSQFEIGSRTGSSAMIAWFLERIWRLEPEEVEDSICDGPGDKGIDAIVVDEDLREITIVQAKRRAGPSNTQGDADLRSLAGTAVYFDSPEAIDALLASGPNVQLRLLITRLGLRQKLEEGGYTIDLVFITNSELDSAGADYVQTMQLVTPKLAVWDGPQLVEIAKRTRRPQLRPETITLAAAADPMEVVSGDLRLVVAIVPASQLVALPGIDDLTLFSRNVRLSLRRTRINRELGDTVSDAAEHLQFPAFHNGLTILTPRLEVHDREITLMGLGVVNGCQSLVVLKDRTSQLTGDLKVLVRVIQVEPATDLADKITYRTNNQNPVDIRDQRSTDAIQRGLQAQVRDSYGADLGYVIRAGEDPGGAEQLDNKLAAQLLMAVYVNEPWNAVRKVRLFDQDYHRIFNHEVDAHRLRLLHELSKAVDSARTTLRPDLASSFASVRFTIAFLVKNVLEETSEGREILTEPGRWLPDQLADVKQSLEGIAREVVDSLNYFVRTREEEAEARGDTFDPKVVFKSATGVESAANEVLRDIRRHAGRDATILFRVPSGR